MTSPILKGSVLKRTATGGASSLDSDYIQFNTSYSDGVAEGRLQWNSEDGTLEVGLPGGSVNLQIGQELLVRCRNNSGVTIANGDVVYISGTHAQATPEITLAQADSATTVDVIGMATEEILNNSFGYVTTFGLVRDVDTLGFTEGAAIYLSETVAGAYQQNRPTTDAGYAVHVGHVLRAHATEGVILCHIDPVSPDELTGTDGYSNARWWDGTDYGWTSSPTFDSLVEVQNAAGAGQLTIEGSTNSLLKMIANPTTGLITINFHNGSTNKGQIQYDYATNHMSFDTNGFERVRIDSSGNVGIGTDAPTRKLVVQRGTGSTITSASTYLIQMLSDSDAVLQFGTPNTASAYIRFSDPDSFGVGAIEYDHASDYLRFTVNSAERVRITSAGDVWFKGGTPSLQVGPTATDGWRDITSEITVRGTGGTIPTWSQIDATGFYAYKFAIGDEAWMVFHIPHDIVPSSDIHLHAHWISNGTNTNTVKWEFEYAFAKGFNQANFDLSALTTQAGTITAEQAGAGSAYRHMVTETAAITLSALTEPDGMIMVHITRITNGGTNNTDDIFLLTADVHYQSTNLATTGKAPDFYT